MMLQSFPTVTATTNRPIVIRMKDATPRLRGGKRSYSCTETTPETAIAIRTSSDRLGCPWLPDGRVDRGDLGRRLKRQRRRVEPSPEVVRLHGQPLTQCLHRAPP
jgi:hypothetical protein